MTEQQQSSDVPTMYVFSISHYCEKARWALEYLGVPFKLQSIAPGFHMRLAKKHQLGATSLPLLVAGDEVVQGSAAIIDWAEQRTRSERNLTPGECEPQCREIEKRLDDVVGVHTRRFFYSEALIEYPEKVKPVFLDGIPVAQKMLLHIMWPRIRPLMIARMDLGEEQWEDSRQKVDGEIQWLDSLLADGRQYLCGERFTRADLTAASLLSRLAGAKEHPHAGSLYLPPRTKLQQEAWLERPSFVWIREMYRRHRNG